MEYVNVESESTNGEGSDFINEESKLEIANSEVIAKGTTSSEGIFVDTSVAQILNSTVESDDEAITSVDNTTVTYIRDSTIVGPNGALNSFDNSEFIVVNSQLLGGFLNNGTVTCVGVFNENFVEESCPIS